MIFNSEEEKKRLINTIDYGLVMDLIKIIVSYCLKNKKTEILEELKVVIKHFYASLNEQELAEFKDDVGQILIPKVEKFKKELESSYSSEQIKLIFDEIKKSSSVLGVVGVDGSEKIIEETFD